MLIALYAHAGEAGMPEPLFKDPAAIRLVGQIDYDFSRFKLRGHDHATTIMQLKEFDRKTIDFLNRHSKVVHIGCGLDTRFDRLDDGVVEWYNLDLPEVNAFLNLPEGETTSVAYKDRGTEVPLGFEIRCNDFEVEFYPNTEMPKAYKSWLTVLKNGQEVMKKAIEVNDPLTYQGITFYQSSYGMVPNSMGKGVLILRAVSKDGRSEQLNLKFRQYVYPSGDYGDRYHTGFQPGAVV